MTTWTSWGRGMTLGLVALAFAPHIAAQDGLAPVDRGWYRHDGVHDPTNYNYLCGNQGSDQTVFRNWFVFDLGAVTETITSASLVLELPPDKFFSPEGEEVYELFEVSTSIAALVDGGVVPGFTIFDDLGTGSSYGSVVVTEADEGQDVVVPLSAAGLAALNAAAGGEIALGGAITSLDGDASTGENVFGLSSDWAVRLYLGAGTVVRDAVDRGWYRDTGFHFPPNTNYLVGNSASNGLEYNNFFVFDLSQVQGTITGATLALEHPHDYTSADPSETYTLFSVDTPIADLVSGALGPQTFVDLGSGTVYGSTQLTSADSSGSRVEIPLDAAGVAALDAAVGGQIAIGGAITTLDADPLTSELDFGSGNPVHGITQLLLEVDGPWTTLSPGLPGTDGAWPRLMGTGALQGGDLVTLTLDRALPVASAWFVLGVAPLSAAFKGGILDPSPDLLFGGLPVDAQGELVFSFPWPVGVPSGVPLHYQEWVVDPGGVWGFAASNGLRSTTP